jgi:hypothetical protein
VRYETRSIDIPRSPERRRSPRGRRLTVATALAGALAAGEAAAEVRWLLEGMADASGHETDATFLGRNDGSAAAVGTLRLWGAVEPHPRLQLVALGEVEGETGSGESEGDLEEAFVRLALRADRKLLLEAGRTGPLLGDFSRRYLPDANPLIGSPVTYGTSYPIAVQLSGVVSIVDLRVAVTDEPITNERFFEEPDSVARPAVAVGVTPMTGLRVGAYHTAGPYLGRGVADRLDPGVRWRTLEQRVSGIDFQFSRGHVELHADWSDVAYDLPPSGERKRGEVWYAEARHTWTPRLFGAVRYEHSRYVAAQWRDTFWLIKEPLVEVTEVGAGWRVAPGTILKASASTERWRVPDQARPFYPDGEAFAVAVVHRFDVLSWFDRQR